MNKQELQNKGYSIREVAAHTGKMIFIITKPNGSTHYLHQLTHNVYNIDDAWKYLENNYNRI